jgi:arginase
VTGSNAPLLVPFHIGELVPGLPIPAGGELLEPDLPQGEPGQRMIALFGELADRVAAGVSLVYAGDCMAPLGVLAGLARRGVSPVVVWLDAHGDFNTPETTPSGYVGGMPLAMLTGRGDLSIVEALGLEKVDTSRVLLADARDLDPEEALALKASGIRTCSDAELAEIAAWVPRKAPVYVHLDVDVVTPSEMPALRFPAAGGPSIERVERCLATLAATRSIVCATVACTWDPAKPDAEKTAAATRRLAAALGRLAAS